MSEEIRLPAGTETHRWVRMQLRLDASPDRVYRCFTDPETLPRWLPDRVEGSLAPNSRSILVWRFQRRSIDVLEADPDRTFRARLPWGPDLAVTTTFTVTIHRSGYGTRLELEDGPFDLDAPGGLDAWAEALESWSEALVLLRAFIDFSIDARERR